MGIWGGHGVQGRERFAWSGMVWVGDGLGGWGPEGVEGPEGVGGPKFRAFFPLQPHFFLLFPLLRVLSCNFGGVFEGQGLEMCTFGLSGCRVHTQHEHTNENPRKSGAGRRRVHGGKAVPHQIGQTLFGQSRFWPKLVWPKSVWPNSVLAKLGHDRTQSAPRSGPIERHQDVTCFLQLFSCRNVWVEVVVSLFRVRLQDLDVASISSCFVLCFVKVLHDFVHRHRVLQVIACKSAKVSAAQWLGTSVLSPPAIVEAQFRVASESAKMFSTSCACPCVHLTIEIETLLAFDCADV